MDQLMQWLDTNKEILFSGLGPAIFVVVVGFIFKRRQAISQVIQSGGYSKNIQAGGDIKIGNKEKYFNVDEK